MSWQNVLVKTVIVKQMKNVKLHVVQIISAIVANKF